MTISLSLPWLLWAFLSANLFLTSWTWTQVGAIQKQIANEFYLLDQKEGARWAELKTGLAAKQTPHP